MVVFRRAIDCWKRYAVEQQQAKASARAVSSLVVIRTVMEWRMQTKVGLRKGDGGGGRDGGGGGSGVYWSEVVHTDKCGVV